ncbi:MAG: DUF499 domain-containing protein, partial [Verrucomicrobiota bacterium]|nr:DUF499 domain-containing protein [Verrucomicrobiota bacterium]
EPTLILMDEIAEYAVKARDFRDQVVAFYQELTETVKVLPQCALVVTLPSSVPYGDEGERVLTQLQRIFGRVEAIYTPVEGEEVYEIVRRRLFEDEPDPQATRRAAEEFAEMYRQLGDDVPKDARDRAYRDRLRRAYPFHPELIDLLFEHWSTYSTFQRTRGVLRFLAEVVADLYAREHAAPLIQPAHLNLGNPAIRRELMKHIGNEYEGVIASDIAGPNAKAGKIDREMGSEYARFGVASGLATAIFFGSFSGSEKKGVGVQRLRLALLRPGIPPAIVGDALRRLEEELWYLHVEQGLYAFSSQPNLNRVIVEKEEAVHDETILEEIRARLEKLAGTEWAVRLWPEQTQDVPDTREMQLAVLGPDHLWSAGRGIEFVEEFLKKCGQTFRAYQNALVVLAPGASEWIALREQVKRYLALRVIRDDRALLRHLSEENKKWLEGKLKDAENGIGFQLFGTYRHLGKAGAQGVDWFDLGLPTVGEKVSLARRVQDFLRGEDLLLSKLPPKRLLDKALRPDEKEKPVEEIVEAFLKYPQLPMVKSESVVREAIAQGVQEGLFGARSGGRTYFREVVPLSVLEYGAVLVRDVAAPGPTASAPGLGEVSATEIVSALGTSAATAARDIYRAVWTQRKKDFRDETQFRQAFVKALQDGAERGLFAWVLPAGGEKVDWGQVLELGQIRKREDTRRTPPAGMQTYRLRVKVSWDKLSDFVRGVVSPLRNDGAELTVEVSLEARAASGGLKQATLDQKVRETLRQIGAEIVHEQQEPS